MKEKFLKVALNRHFFDKHRQVLIAVSGGLDSMTLLDLLVTYQSELGIQIAIAYVHHGQRREADEEAAYLENYAKKLDIPFHFSRFQGIFSEKNARDFRYQFFQNLMVEFGYTALVTAHHADDQAETVLMRLIRGGRLFNLSAIKERQKFGPGELIRPLLSFSKSEFPVLFHFEDDSNQSDQYLRNRIRHQYLPILGQENPQFKSNLLLLSEDVHQLEVATQYFLNQLDYSDLAVFSDLPVAVQSLCLQDLLTKWPELQVTRKQFDEMLYVIQQKRNHIYPIQTDYQLIVDYTRFYIEKINPETDGQRQDILLESGNIVTVGNYEIGYNRPLADANQVIALPNLTPVTLRHRQKGDQILIRGHHKKVRRLFMEEKVTLSERQQAVVVEQSGKILGILEIVTSDLSKSLKNDTIKGILYIKNK